MLYRKPLLLDLFCGAGGAGEGYLRAGFDIVGVDSKPQPRYPGRFVLDDALTYLENNHSMYDAVHASPPCQAYSRCAHLPQCRVAYPLLIDPVRDMLEHIGKTYIIENVVGAPLKYPVMLCGTMFGLRLFRHRLFESNCLLLVPVHECHRGLRIGKDGFTCVAVSHDAGKAVRVPADHRTLRAWQKSMGIDWMQKREITQAIPPAYTHFLGVQLLQFI